MIYATVNINATTIIQSLESTFLCTLVRSHILIPTTAVDSTPSIMAITTIVHPEVLIVVCEVSQYSPIMASHTTLDNDSAQGDDHSESGMSSNSKKT